MATTKFLLDMRYVRQDGKYPLKIQLTHNRQSVHFSLGIYLSSKQWQENEVVDHKLKNYYNTLILKEKLRIDKIIIQLTEARRIYDFTAKGLKKYIESVPERIPPEGGTESALSEILPPSFIAYAKRFISLGKKNRTQEIYLSTLNKLKAFKGENIEFHEVTPTWLQNFDEFMVPDTPALNARSIHFRNIRAIFNAAIRDKIIDPKLYPFGKGKYIIRTQKTPKRSLTVQQLRGIRDVTDPKLKPYADTFMLIFYLAGINIIDLLNLTEITDGRIHFHRAKTARYYSIKVEPEAREIINRYHGDKILLVWGEHYKDYRNFTKRFLKELKKIGKLKTVGCPCLSSYYARHSVATLAANKLNIPKDTISHLLGHGEETVTDIYIDFDQEKVDKAMRKVIDLINKDLGQKK
mgnify:FL=1